MSECVCFAAGDSWAEHAHKCPVFVRGQRNLIEERDMEVADLKVFLAQVEQERDEARELHKTASARVAGSQAAALRLKAERDRYEAALRTIGSNMMSRTDMVETAREALEAGNE